MRFSLHTMIIGIDGSILAIKQSCGSKNYAVNLINSISRVDDKNTYYVFATKNAKKFLPKNVNHVIIPSFPIFKRQIFLAYLVSRYKIDVFHILDPYGSIFIKHDHTIVTVHDCDLKKVYPSKRTFLHRIACEFLRSIVIKKADRVIAVSKFTKRELFNIFPDSKKVTTTIYESAGDEFFDTKKVNGNKPKHFLCMGDLTPRKNIRLTMKAYSLLPKKIRFKYPLVIIASTTEAAKIFDGLRIKLEIVSNVSILVNISNRKLITCYSNAIAFVYPSFYEGFGLPILEAMACGSPVITSDLGAMREIAGGAAILVDPNSVRSIANAMKNIVSDPKLANHISELGLKRSREFSWQNAANKTILVYEHTKTG